MLDFRKFINKQRRWGQESSFHAQRLVKGMMAQTNRQDAIEYADISRMVANETNTTRSNGMQHMWAILKMATAARHDPDHR
ncbi:MAG: hypothetical protein U0936_00050 [Planctomycetaceae bacterium]